MNFKRISKIILCSVGILLLNGCNNHSHTLVKHERIDASCINSGIEEYYECSDCLEKFIDTEGKTKVTDEELVIDINPSNHSYLDDGDCTTKVLCTLCEEEVVSAKEDHLDDDLDTKCNECNKALDLYHDKNTNTVYIYSVDGLYEATKIDANIELMTDITLPDEMIFEDSNFSNFYLKNFHFDGNNHTISNLKSTNEYNSLFYLIDEFGIVENLNLIDVKMSGSGTFCALADSNYGIIRNVTISGTFKSDTNSVVPFVRINRGKIINCSTNAVLEGPSGLSGFVNENSGDVIGCYSVLKITTHNSDIYGAKSSGIVAGSYAGNIVGCYSIIDVVIDDTEKYHMTGGIVGYNEGALLNNYWFSNQSNILYGDAFNNTCENASFVDGTSITWEMALEAMNEVLKDYDCEFSYVLNTNEDSNIYPLIFNK